MERIAIGVEVKPEITQAKHEESRPGGQESDHALSDSNQATIVGDKFDAPGDHAQGLSAASPEPDIKATAAGKH